MPPFGPYFQQVAPGVVAALGETIRLMGAVDEAIGTHGGWPPYLPFSLPCLPSIYNRPVRRTLFLALPCQACYNAGVAESTVGAALSRRRKENLDANP